MKHIRTVFLPLLLLLFGTVSSCSGITENLEGDLKEARMLLLLSPGEAPASQDGTITTISETAETPLENLWATLTNMPTRLQYGRSVTVNNKIYNIGSYSTQKIRVEYRVCLFGCSMHWVDCNDYGYDAMTVYAPQTGSWSSQNKTSARRYVAVAERNGLIYTFGGNYYDYKGIERYSIIGGGARCLYSDISYDRVESYDPDGQTTQVLRPMPHKRFGATASVVGGKIYLIGGNLPNLVEEYDPDSDTWVQKANMPTGRSYAVASVVNNKIYVIGGDISPYNQVEEYDPATDTWSARAVMPTGRYNATAEAYNNRIYVMGGYPKAPYDQVQEYNPATNIWAPKATMPTGRYGLYSGVYNSQIYAIGGGASVIETFDPAGDAWTKIDSNLQTARAYHTATLYNNKVYVFGGYNGSYLSSAEGLAFPANSWSPLAAMPVARRYHAAVELNGLIYLIGGHNAGGTLGSVDVYDPATDAYSAAAPLQVARQSHAACVKGGKIYVFGGNTSGSTASALNSVEEYDPATNQWVFRQSMSDYRTHMTCAVDGDLIYLAGGMDSAGTALTRTESYDFRFDVWSVHQAMSVARYQMGMVKLRGRLYAMGGRNASLLSSAEKFDAALEQWIPENSMTNVRLGVASIATDDHIYAIGGYNGSSYLKTTDLLY